LAEPSEPLAGATGAAPEPAQAAPLLAGPSELLAGGDTRVLALCEEQAGALRAALGAGYDALLRKLGALDFDGALGLLKRIMQPRSG